MDSGALAIRQIMVHKGDYYAMLSVGRNADEAELTKAYRKLSLKVHPDRNKSHGAEEAFKLVGQAYATLKDPKQRQVYDVHGEEGLKAGDGGAHRYRHQQPEDVFDIFEQLFSGAGVQFGGPPRRYRRQGANMHQHHQQMNPQHVAKLQLLQILPVLFFFLVYLMMGLGLGEDMAPYSLQYDRDNGYTQRRQTKRHDIAYFVPRNFDKEYGSSRKVVSEIERSVVASYKQHLRVRCSKERSTQQAMRQRAQMYYSGKQAQQMREQAESQPMTACKEYDRIFGASGYR